MKHQIRQDGWTRLCFCSRGSNAVEFALVAPVFIMLLFGVVSFGLYLGTSHSLAQLAAEGARSALSGLDAAERAAISRDRVNASAPDYPLLDPDRVVVDTSETDQVFKVVVRYDTSHLPIWDFGFGDGMASKVIERAAVARVARF